MTIFFSFHDRVDVNVSDMGVQGTRVSGLRLVKNLHLSISAASSIFGPVVPLLHTA